MVSFHSYFFVFLLNFDRIGPVLTEGDPFFRKTDAKARASGPAGAAGY